MKFSSPKPEPTSRPPRRKLRCCRDDGFTLIEVVVGLVLLATLLVGVLQAYGAHHRQLAHARDQLVAAQLADDMLAAWVDAPRGVPRQAAGLIPQHPSWAWRTQVRGRREVAELPVEIIRFEIVSSGATPEDSRLLSAVEIVQAVPVEGTP